MIVPMVPPLLQKLIWLTVATSFFVMFEPAPCDALLGFTLIAAAIAGRRYVLPSVGFGIYASLFVVVLANLVSLALAHGVRAGDGGLFGDAEKLEGEVRFHCRSRMGDF